MATKTIKAVIFGTEEAFEKEIDINERCAFCNKEAIAAIHFPEPYKVQPDETLEVFGDVCYCLDHLLGIRAVDNS